MTVPLKAASRRLLAFHALVAEVYARARAVDVRQFEELDAAAMLAALGRQVHELLSSAIAVFAEIVEACEANISTDLSFQISSSVVGKLDEPVAFERAHVASHRGQPTDRTSVADLTYVASLELRQRLLRVASLSPSHGRLLVLSECDAALVRTERALSAVDRSIAELEGVAPRIGHPSVLQQSLGVRRAYVRFHRRVLARGEEVTEAELLSRMRGAGTAIAVLIGWDIYRELRVRDRLQLRDLQRRILDWLNPQRRGPADGVSIWRDLVTFVQMLLQVSKREELLEHDLGLLRKICAEIETGALPDWPSCRKQLVPLTGLDPELDELLALEEERVVPANFREISARLISELAMRVHGRSGLG